MQDGFGSSHRKESGFFFIQRERFRRYACARSGNIHSKTLYFHIDKPLALRYNYSSENVYVNTSARRDKMITTLLFDLGGTLHSVIRKEDSMVRYAERLIRRLSDYGIVLDTTPERLAVSLHENAEAYKHLSERTLTELPEAKIWNEHYLREFQIGEERLAPIAEELSFQYDYDRLTMMRKPRLKETIEELHRMGIRMGIVSNIISTSLVPHMLNEYGIAQYMECIVMSSETGIRKPDPRIFAIALERMGVTAAETGYVGDTISRDVLGAKNAHLGLVVRLNNPSIAHRDAAFQGADAPQADFVIHELYELPEILRSVNGR